MFVYYRTRGLILKKEDRGEADRIFTVFTQEFGKLELLAKSERKIKSKLRSGLELFYLSDIEFIRGKAQKTLTDAILISDFKNLRDDLVKLKISYRISEVFNKLVKAEEKDERIWDLLIEVFEKNNEKFSKTSIPGLTYYYFLWNFFVILGYGPELYFCSFCQKKVNPENLYFSPQEGGLICHRCKNLAKIGADVSDKTIKIIRIFLEKDWSILMKLKINKDDLKSIKVFSDYYFEEIFDKMI